MTLTDVRVPGSLSAAMQPDPAELRSARRRLHGKAVGIATLFLASYAGLVLLDVRFWVRVVCAVGLVLACITLGTSVMHDANHGSFSRSRRVNRIVGWTADFLGASSMVWRIKHNSMHHANTNVNGEDGDIDQQPLARLTPQQEWHWWHRFQHLYLWFLYGFLVIKWVTVTDVAYLVQGRVGTHRLPPQTRRRDALGVLAGKAVHFGWAVVIPLFFFPWWAVAAFYLACSWTVGFTLSVIFQLAHCVDGAAFPDRDAARRGPDFELHQLRTTADVASPVRVVRIAQRWLMGGLDFQVEHHLAPRLPHTLYPVVAPRLAAACRERGLVRSEHRHVGAALRSHGRWLMTMGRMPTGLAAPA